MVTSLNNTRAAREAGYEMVQYISARAAPTGGVSVYSIKVGTLPAGAIILAASTNVETAITGSTPAFHIGTTAGSGGSEIASTIAVTAGSLNTVPVAALVQPLVADTDVYANITGTATGDAYIIIQFVKPLA